MINKGASNMVRIITKRRLGLEIYIVQISIGRAHREAVFMSEQGARDGMTRMLKALGAKI